jgi:SNF2 family DNA or RNA helicase
MEWFDRSMLDLVEVPLREAGWQFGRYDGSLSLKARERVLAEFKTDPHCNVLLMSLKCGSLGKLDPHRLFGFWLLNFDLFFFF